MFDRHRLRRDGAQAQALVLEKNIYATQVESGRTSACRRESGTPRRSSEEQRRRADSGSLRIGDVDRELIAEVLSQHMADGRLTTDELEDRLGALYTAQTQTQTRAQARSVLAGLAPLAGTGARRTAS